MSYWLGYVVIDRGQAHLATDYHGYGFLASVVDGQDAVLARIAGSGPGPYVAGDLEAYEGAMLIDLDRAVLAMWNHDAGHGDRRIILPEVRRAWPGYDVRWAYGGAADIEAYLGLPPRPGNLPEVQGWRPYQTWRQPWDESFFLVTVDAAAYALEVPDPADLLAGPDEAVTLPDAWRIENLTTWWRDDRPLPLPDLGLHLDMVRRIATCWTVTTIEGVPQQWSATWPGWQWVFEHDAYDLHYERCDELVRMFLPTPLPFPGWPPLRDRPTQQAAGS